MDLAKGRTLLSGAVCASLCIMAGCKANAVRSESSGSRPLASSEVVNTTAYQGSYVAAGSAGESYAPVTYSPPPRVTQASVAMAPVRYQPMMPSSQQTGLATEGVPLRADTSSLYDPDGIGNIRFQWQVGDGRGGWSDIPRANTSTYVPSQGDVGRQLRLVVSYVDGQGNFETIVTGASNPVFNVNNPPAGNATIDGFAEEDQLLVVDTDDIRDEDGLGRFDIRWEKTLDRHSWRKIDRAVGDRLVLDQSDVGYYIRAVVSYTDAQGTREQLYTLPTEAVRNVDDPTQGEIRIVGQPMENRTLGVDVASLADEDGMGDVSVSWQISHDGKLWRDLAGETGPQVVLAQDYVGQRLRAVGHYRDNFGTDYYLASESTSPVANLNDAPRGSVRIIGLGDYPLDRATSSAASFSPQTSTGSSRMAPTRSRPIPQPVATATRTAAPMVPAPVASAPVRVEQQPVRPAPVAAPVAPVAVVAEPEAVTPEPVVDRMPAPKAEEVKPAPAKTGRPAPFLSTVVGKLDPKPEPAVVVEKAVEPAPVPAVALREVEQPRSDVVAPTAVVIPRSEVVVAPAPAVTPSQTRTQVADPLPDAVLLSTLPTVDEDSSPQTITISDLVPTAFLKAGGEVTGLQLADPSYGVLRRRTDNTWQFTPALDFNGDAIFRIDTRVPIGGDKVYKAKMPIRSVNDPPAQTKAVLTVNVVVGEGGFIAVGNLLEIFVDADGDRLQLTSASLRDLDGGQLKVEPNGQFELRYPHSNDARPVVRVEISDGVEKVSGVVRLALMASRPPQR